MGACANHEVNENINEANVNSRLIATQLHVNERREHHIKKIVLLGTKSCGGSTILKQLSFIYSSVIEHQPEEQRKKCAHIIRQNIISGILQLLYKSQELYDKDCNKFNNCLVDIYNENTSTFEAIQYIVRADAQFSMTEHMANALIIGYIREYEIKIKVLVPAEIVPIFCSFYPTLFEQQYDEMQKLGSFIQQLWYLNAVQNTFAARYNNFVFPDNMDYYFNKVADIFSPYFYPNEQDTINCKYPKTESVEATYEIEEWEFNILCCDYYRIGKTFTNKIWMMFDKIPCVIYVAALNHYTSVSLTNNHKNAMHESIELFDDIMNCKWFRQSEIILFLNKDDLFRECLRNQYSLRDCFHSEHGWDGQQWDVDNKQHDIIDYEPQDDIQQDMELFERCYEASIDFIKNQYVEKNKYQYKVVFVHVTTAVDRTNVERVFWDVQNILIRSSLKRS